MMRSTVLLPAQRNVSQVSRCRAPSTPAVYAPVRPMVHDRTAPKRTSVKTFFKEGEKADAAAAAPAAEAVPHYKQALAKLGVPKDEPTRKLMVVTVAPAVRVAISEAFGLAPGATSAGQLAEALRRLGFDHVLDLTFAADVCIMEEGYELLTRLQDHLTASPHDDHPMPMFTSCCPGWITLVEKSYPDLIPYLSTCKSPQMMGGALVKTYLAELNGVKPSDVCVVSIMPCVRKQGEANREWFSVDEGVSRDVDHVITTAELGAVLKERGIMVHELPEGTFDAPMGMGSTAGVLFGSTGGVMEAALRTAYEVVTASKLEKLVFEEVRGVEGIKEATITMSPPKDSPLAKTLAERMRVRTEAAAAAGKPKPLAWAVEGKAAEDGTTLSLRVAVANGLGNAKKLITKMQSGEAHFDFVEVMACPNGCVSGAGQPRSTDKQVGAKRQAALYTLDERNTLRRSHENPMVQTLYAKFLGQPLSHKAHDLLHTHYCPGGPAGDQE